MSATIDSYLQKGFSEDQVLKMIDKVYPSISRAIKSFEKTGKNAKEIVYLLSSLSADQMKKADKNAEKLDFRSPLEKANEAAISQEKNALQQGLNDLGKMAIAAGGIYGTSKVLPRILGITESLQKELSTEDDKFKSTISPSTLTEQEMQPPEAGVSIPAKAAEQIFSNKKSIGPTPMSNAPVAAPQISSASNITPEGQQRSISLDLANRMTPDFKQYAEKRMSEGSEGPLEAMLADFEKTKGKEKPNKFSSQFARDVEKMSQGPEKGGIVSTPDGNVGYIKDIKKSEALVDEDGKLHRLKIEDLQLPDETVVQTVTRLLEMPEIDKSSIINYWAYDPEDEEILLMFHNGELYKYSEIPEELRNELSEASVSPKTKGENEYGAWSQEDPQSRGATFIQKLIAHPKYKKTKKGEKPNPFYRKLEKEYDYWQRLRK